MQNLALEAHGIAARVDHRSLAAQGIRDREPGLHQGPAVAGIEARGERSEVGDRQREQMAQRQAAREQVRAQERELEHQLERQVLAAERVAARERRELVPLAAAAPKAEQALDQAQPEQHSLFTRLVNQAKALQQRIEVAYERIKDWAQEKFRPERVRELGREMLAAGKAEFRAAYEKHRAEQAERKRQLELGKQKYQEHQKQQQLEQERKRAAELQRVKDRDYGLER